MKISLVLFFTLLTVPVWALDDTAANREQEAARYLQASPPKDMLKIMLDEMAKDRPPDQRKDHTELMLKHINNESLTKVMTQSLVKNFTADELKALADFYGSSAGKSAMNKFRGYMQDAMPGIQAEMIKAQAEINQEKK